MKYVSLLQSLSVPTQRYVGVTTNLDERLLAHNAGASLHTSKYRPWRIVTYLCFQDDARAGEFERYLKSGSGQVFANKRLWYVSIGFDALSQSKKEALVDSDPERLKYLSKARS